jgi:uncharacterized membrane protein
VADLIAIVYPDEATGLRAAQEAERVAHELVVQPDAIAAVSRNAEGRYQIVTNHLRVGAGPTWSGFWGLLFGMLFVLPVFGLVLAVGLGEVAARLESAGVDRGFQEEVRELLRPGTSAVFVLVARVPPAAAADALASFGGTVLVSPLAPETEAELQAALQGGSRVRV